MIVACFEIAFAAGVVSRYSSNPNSDYVQAGRRVLTYSEGTVNLRIIRFPQIPSNALGALIENLESGSIDPHNRS